jgi:hypothetical protein
MRKILHYEDNVKGFSTKLELMNFVTEQEGPEAQIVGVVANVNFGFDIFVEVPLGGGEYDVPC